MKCDTCSKDDDTVKTVQCEIDYCDLCFPCWAKIYLENDATLHLEDLLQYLLPGDHIDLLKILKIVNHDFVNEFVKHAFIAGFNSGCLESKCVLSFEERDLLCDKWWQMWIKKRLKGL